MNFGDLDVTANGNLLIASSDESEIGEYTVTGAWVTGHALPGGTGSLCGIGVDAAGCNLFTISTGGVISELAATCPQVATIGNGCPSSGGNNAITVTQMPWAGSLFRSDATGLPANCFALAVYGFSQQPTPLPLAALLPQGAPGCFAYTSSEIVLLLTVNGGATSSTLDLPQGIAGFVFYHQIGVVELDAGFQVLSATSTDALRCTVGSY